MDALIRVMVGAAALCAASVACAGPVVVDGDPDEPDIGGGVAEPVTPRHTPQPAAKSIKPAIKEPQRSATNTLTRITLNCDVVDEQFLDAKLAKSFNKNITIQLDLQKKVYSFNHSGDWSNLYSVDDNNIVMSRTDWRQITLDRFTGKYSSYISDRDRYVDQQEGVCKPSKEVEKLF